MPRRALQGGVDAIEIMRVCWLRYSSCRATTLELVSRLGYRIEGEVKSPEDLIEKMTRHNEEEVEGMPPAEAESEAARKTLEDVMHIIETLTRLYPGLD